MADVIKIGNVELTEEEAWRLYEKQLYIVTYSKIYQLHYSAAQQRVYGSQIYYQPGLAQRSRFHAMSAEAVNRLLKFDLVKTSDARLEDKIASAIAAKQDVSAQKGVDRCSEER